MFFYCGNILETNFTQFDTKNVTNMSCIFNNCSSLKTLDVSKFDTKNVTRMDYMFSFCSSLNKNIRILNSYEECIRTEPDENWIKDEKYRNEDEIKRCEIEINNKLLTFSFVFLISSFKVFNIIFIPFN